MVLTVAYNNEKCRVFVMPGDVSVGAPSWTTVDNSICGVYPMTGIESSDAANDRTSRKSMVLPGCILTGFELMAAPSRETIRNSYAESYVPYQTDYYPPTSLSSLLGFLRQDVEQVVVGEVPRFDVDGNYWRRPSSRGEYSSLASHGCCEDLKGYEGNDKTLSHVSELTLTAGDVASTSVSYSVETVSSSCAQSNADVQKFYGTTENEECRQSNDCTGDFAEVAAYDQVRIGRTTEMTRTGTSSDESAPFYEPLEVTDSNLEESETRASADKVPSDVGSLLLAVVVTKNNAVDCSLPTDEQVSDPPVGLKGHCE